MSGQHAETIGLVPKSVVKGKVGVEKYQPSTGGYVLQVFLHTDMRNGHDGLAEVAAEAKIDVRKLLPGQYVCFVNNAEDKIKLYAANNVVASHHLPKGQKFELRAIAFIPQAFNGSLKLAYDDSLKAAVEEALRRRKSSVSSQPAGNA